MRILVTGGGGFLGQALCRRLLELGHDVRSISRSAYPELAAMGVQSIRGDIANYEQIKSAVSGCDAVIHTAAKAGVWGSYEEFYAANVIGTENTIKACRECGVGRLIFTSSPSIVFDGYDQEGIDESAPIPRKFLAHYPQTKALAEKLVLAANSDQLATISLRPHLIWGPGDNHLIPRVIRMAKKGRLRLLGNEDKLVDSVYIDNAVDAHMIALEKLEVGTQVSGRAFFITNQEPVPMSFLINGILHAASLPGVSRRIPSTVAYCLGSILEGLYQILKLPGEPPMTRFVARQLSTAHWYDDKAARQDLGYTAKISLTEGFRRLASTFH